MKQRFVASFILKHVTRWIGSCECRHGNRVKLFFYYVVRFVSFFPLSSHVTTVGPCVAMEDVAAGLKSLSFESGLGAEEKELLHLRARAAGLAFCRCAHALYLCELVRSLRWVTCASVHTRGVVRAAAWRPSNCCRYRCAIRGQTADRATEEAPGGDGDLCVGILGAGHQGKQLLLSLLEMTDIQPAHVKVSTRRPELAG